MSEIALFIHSTGTGPFMWRPFAAQLPAGITAVMPVNRGYAPTDVLPMGSAFSVQDEVAHLKAQIPSGTTGIHLCAHSYGGFVALTMAMEAGLPVKSLWLYEPVLFGALRSDLADAPPEVVQQVSELYGERSLIQDDIGGTEAWIERFIDYWNRPGMWASMPEKAKAMTRPVGWKMYREVWSVSTEPTSFADYRVDVPLTLVYGAQTTPPAREMVRRLAQVNPGALVNALPDLGHMGLLSAPEAVSSSLLAHWARVCL